MFDGPLTESILKRAQEKRLLSYSFMIFGLHRTSTVPLTIRPTAAVGDGDDARPAYRGSEDVRGPDTSVPVILLTPQRVFTQRPELAQHPGWC